MTIWNSTLKRKTPLRAAPPRQASRDRAAKVRSPMKSRGMKGRAPTAEQRRFWDQLSGLGCVACRLVHSAHLPEVSIHHIEGRTKPDAHWLVLPLCAGHHQDGTGLPGLVAVHPWKARFESIYGTQRNLLRVCIQTLLGRGQELPEGALAAAGMDLRDQKGISDASIGGCDAVTFISTFQQSAYSVVSAKDETSTTTASPQSSDSALEMVS